MKSVKIKQQQQIKMFLGNEFGKEIGTGYFQKQAELLKNMIIRIEGKTEIKEKPW